MLTKIIEFEISQWIRYRTHHRVFLNRTQQVIFSNINWKALLFRVVTCERMWQTDNTNQCATSSRETIRRDHTANWQRVITDDRETKYTKEVSFTFSRHSKPLALWSSLTSMTTAFGWLTKHHIVNVHISPRACAKRAARSQRGSGRWNRERWDGRTLSLGRALMTATARDVRRNRRTVKFVRTTHENVTTAATSGDSLDGRNTGTGAIGLF